MRYKRRKPMHVNITSAVMADANRADHRPLLKIIEAASLLLPADGGAPAGGGEGGGCKQPFSAVHCWQLPCNSVNPPGQTQSAIDVAPVVAVVVPPVHEMASDPPGQ